MQLGSTLKAHLSCLVMCTHHESCQYFFFFKIGSDPKSFKGFCLCCYCFRFAAVAQFHPFRSRRLSIGSQRNVSQTSHLLLWGGAWPVQKNRSLIIFFCNKVAGVSREIAAALLWTSCSMSAPPGPDESFAAVASSSFTSSSSSVVVVKVACSQCYLAPL